MRVALNTAILRAPRTGIGRYVAELSKALAAQSDLELLFFDGMRWRARVPESPLPGYSRAAGVAKHLLPNAYTLRRQLQQLSFAIGARNLRPQVYHEPSLWPLEFDGPMLMTVHDLTHVHYPQTQPPDRLREIERRFPAALQRTQRILFDSRFIASEAQQHYGIPAHKVTVAPLGAAAHFHPRSDEELAPVLSQFGVTPRHYLLCVGTLEPRKNLQFGLECYLMLPAALRQQFPLLIAGMPGWHTDQLAPHLHRAITSGQVHLIGYQDDATVAALLAGARLLLFPSLYEGFGLPVVEAMASGTPTLVSRISAMPEVAGDSACYFEPGDSSGCLEGMLRLINDDGLWTQQRDAGLLRARGFTWAECARITADIYRQVATH